MSRGSCAASAASVRLERPRALATRAAHACIVDAHASAAPPERAGTRAGAGAGCWFGAGVGRGHAAGLGGCRGTRGVHGNQLSRRWRTGQLVRALLPCACLRRASARRAGVGAAPSRRFAAVVLPCDVVRASARCAGSWRSISACRAR
jgi:hypothetical protein